jgi:hypothetical protein
MASNVTVIWHSAGNEALDKQGIMPVVRLPEARAEIVAASGASAQSVLDADQLNPATRTKDGGFVTVVAAANAIWVASGQDPTAIRPTAGNPQAGFPIAANEAVTFAINYNDKIAVIE